MENAPVITLNGYSPYPGVDIELWERYTKWNVEVYAPMLSQHPGRKGFDTYQIIKENPLYPLLLTINHHENITSLQDTFEVPEQNLIRADDDSWIKRNVMDRIWIVPYQVVKGFRSEHAFPDNIADTRVQNATIMHLEAFRLTSDDQDNYNMWLSEYGINIFIPLFVKQQGVKGYDFFEIVYPKTRTFIRREQSYPIYITIAYFENIKAFEVFERSPERATFLKTMRNIFPLGLNYTWYVQYQLMKSWRK